MPNRYILTPYSLDKKNERLLDLARPSWHINTPELPEGDIFQRMTALNESLAGFVERAIRDKVKPISVTNDCCAAIGVLAGLQRAGLNPALVWFDAHGDFNTWETSPSGFLGGMPLAMIVGRGERRLVCGVGLAPLAEENVILAGARDLDPGEAEAIKNSRIRYLHDALSLIGRNLGAGPLHVHFDTDIVNPKEAPAMPYRAPGGPSKEELGDVFRFLCGTGNIAAVSLCTWSAEMEGAEESRRVCMDLLRILSGEE